MTSLACPACGRPPGSTLACLRCGRVLEEAAGTDHYARLGLPRGIEVDEDALEAAYLRLSRALHPDFHGAADEAVRGLVNRHSARLNEARHVLADEQLRAEYLLELLAPGALEAGKTLPPVFLMKAMELSEEAEASHGDPAAREALARRVRAQIEDRAAVLRDPAAWSAPDAARLATLIHEQRVLRRVLRDTEEDA